MLFQSRATGAIDPQRLAAAVARPGIDPRVNLSLGVILDIKVESAGVFVDVELHPSQNTTTVRVGTNYAGGGFGDYSPLMVDDEVLIGFPDGEPDSGGVILARLWSAADLVPNTAVSNPGDRLIQTHDGKSVRISGNGATVQVDENGSILLIGADGSMVYVDAKSGESGLKFVDATGNNVTMDKDGIALVDKAGSSIVLDGTGTAQVAAANVVVSGVVVNITSGSIALGPTSVPPAASFAVRGTELVAALLAFSSGLTPGTLVAQAAILNAALGLVYPAPGAMLSLGTTVV